jgi:hypothetical protein
MNRIWTAGLVALTIGIAAACNNDASLNVSQSTRARAVNAAPDAGALRVSVAGKKFDNLAYGKGTDYQTINGGEQQVQVQTVVGNQTVLDQKQSFTAGADYTVAIAGSGSNLVPIIVTDDNAKPPTGQAKFRVINTAPGAPAMDVYVSTPGADLLSSTPTLTSLSPGNASSYAQLAAGSYEVRVTQAGSKQVFIDIGPITVNDGDIQTGIILAAPGGGAPYSATVLTATPKQ